MISNPYQVFTNVHLKDFVVRALSQAIFYTIQLTLYISFNSALFLICYATCLTRAGSFRYILIGRLYYQDTNNSTSVSSAVLL